MFDIVIPNYGIKGIDLTDNLLNSISNFYNSNLENIIISDDGSKLDTMLELTKLKDKYQNIFNIDLIFNPYFHSFSKTVNNGIRNSNPNNDILLLNNDMLALTSFTPFCDFIKQNSHLNKIGVIGAKLLYPNLTIQHAGIIRRKFTRDFDHIYMHEDANYPDAQLAHKYIAITGACMYISRELIDTIGLLDETYILSFEDVDYCVNAQFNNYDVWYIPDVSLIHYESMTRDKSNDLSNRNVFWKKWELLFDKVETSFTNEQKEFVVTIASIVGLIYFLRRKSKSMNKN